MSIWLDPRVTRYLDKRCFWMCLWECFQMKLVFGLWIIKYLASPVWIQFSSVAQSYLTLCDPMNCSTPGFPVHRHLLEFAQVHIHCLCDANSTIPSCRPLLLLPSIFPCFRVFSNELTFPMRWPKHWELQLQHQSFQRLFRVDFL